MTTVQTITAVVLWTVVLTLLLLVLLLYRQVERAYQSAGVGRGGGLLPGVEFPAIEIMTEAGQDFLQLPTDSEPYLVAFATPDCDGCITLLNTLAKRKAFEGVAIGVLIDPVPQGRPVPEFPEGLPIYGAASPLGIRRSFGITTVPLLYVMRERTVLASGTVLKDEEITRLLQEAERNEADLRAVGVDTQSNGNDPTLAASTGPRDG